MPNASPPTLARAVVAAIAAAGLLLLLVGPSSYPSSPLLSPPPSPSARRSPANSSAQSSNDAAECAAGRDVRRSPRREGGRPPWHRRLRLSAATSAATASFALAASARTVVVAPLMRLNEFFGFATTPGAVVERSNALLDAMERISHSMWEDVASISGAWDGEREEGEREDGDRTTADRAPSFESRRALRRGPPEVDLELAVPCDESAARRSLLEGDGGDDRRDGSSDGGSSGDDGPCKLRDVITRDLLAEYARTFHDPAFDLATHPIVLRNAWSPASFADGRSRRRLTPTGILTDPELSNLVLPNYFSDATKAGYDALVPDEDRITLSEFLRGILSGETPAAKIGTQVVIEELPELRDEIVPEELARDLFGWTTTMDDWKERAKDRATKLATKALGDERGEKVGRWIGRWTRKLPSMSTYPVFVAGNAKGEADSEGGHPRTDLHAEPIERVDPPLPFSDDFLDASKKHEDTGNVASQLHGARRWTFVPTEWTGLLRPTISRRRGYFYSNMDPLSELPRRLESLPVVYECVTRRGDAVWGESASRSFAGARIARRACVRLMSLDARDVSVPPWVWHRVDYDTSGQPEESLMDGREGDEDASSLSIGASVFHFYPDLYATNFPLFGLLIVPNLIMEALGFNVE
ncbi:hypothetical protein ACHAWF_009652 [Thalassiosira exigua]